MIALAKAKQMGVDRCIDLIGREFCKKNRSSSVCSFGVIDNVVDVFVGVSDGKREEKSFTEKPFKYKAFVYVDMKDGSVSDGEYVSAE